MAAKDLAAGICEIYQAPLNNIKDELKELISKQNQIYIDIAGEKFVFENNEILEVQNMMGKAKIYREKLNTISKQMNSIHQRTKSLKKRALNIQAVKEKEVASKA
ncbi:hypothetical protein ACFFRR_007724 [Megaselia abdita]